MTMDCMSRLSLEERIKQVMAMAQREHLTIVSILVPEEDFEYLQTMGFQMYDYIHEDAYVLFHSPSLGDVKIVKTL